MKRKKTHTHITIHNIIEVWMALSGIVNSVTVSLLAYVVGEPSALNCICTPKLWIKGEKRKKKQQHQTYTYIHSFNFHSHNNHTHAIFYITYTCTYLFTYSFRLNLLLLLPSFVQKILIVRNIVSDVFVRPPILYSLFNALFLYVAFEIKLNLIVYV